MDATTADAGKQPPPPSKRDGVDWLTPEQAAVVLNVSLAQLEKWRARDDVDGPPWFRFGPRTPRYLRDELHRWALSKRVAEEVEAEPRRANTGASVLLVRTSGEGG